MTGGVERTGSLDALLESSAAVQADALAARDVAAVELVEASIRRIQSRNEALAAFVLVDGESALDHAREADRRRASGEPVPPLTGVPIGVKDNVAVVGMRMTSGSRAFADRVPAGDAAVVRRIRKAGMVIVGKTNTPEFAALPFTDSDLFGPCRNPWDVERNAGGSSGGAGASLATAMVPLALGTDAGGSIRIPSAFCGVQGLKPSRGRVSLGPDAGERLAGLAVDGPMARTATDLGLLLDAIAGYESGDPYWLPDPDVPFAQAPTQDPGVLRIGVAVESPVGGDVDGDCRAAVDRGAAVFADLGHRVDAHDVAWSTDAVGQSLKVIWGTLNAHYGNPDRAQTTDYNQRQAKIGDATTALEYVTARLEMDRAARRILSAWEEIDVLLTPTTALPAPGNDFISSVDAQTQIQRVLQLTSFTRWFNVTGQPALSLPFGATESGLPVGIQLVGPPGGEALLLQLAGQLERAGHARCEVAPEQRGRASG